MGVDEDDDGDGEALFGESRSTKQFERSWSSRASGCEEVVDGREEMERYSFEREEMVKEVEGNSIDEDDVRVAFRRVGALTGGEAAEADEAGVVLLKLNFVFGTDFVFFSFTFSVTVLSACSGSITSIATVRYFVPSLSGSGRSRGRKGLALSHLPTS